MSAPRIVVEGTIVRIIADVGTKLDLPRRQGFAWAKNAQAYAKQLSRERGWPIEEARG